MRVACPPMPSLADAVRSVRALVIESPAWTQLAEHYTLGSSRRLALLDTLLRRPGLTLSGYVAHIHGYHHSILADLLAQVVRLELMHVDRGRYWPTATSEAFSNTLRAATDATLASWARLPAQQSIAALSQRMLSAIPRDHLATHPLYAYGARPGVERQQSSAHSALLACTALDHYRMDAQALAWAANGIGAAQGIILHLLARATTSVRTDRLIQQTAPYLGATASDVLASMQAADWITDDCGSLRLTACGWTQWLPITQHIHEQLEPLVAALSPTEHQQFSRNVAQLRRGVSRQHRAKPAHDRV